ANSELDTEESSLVSGWSGQVSLEQEKCTEETGGFPPLTVHVIVSPGVTDGPSETGVIISGPVSFLADGKKNITLTCKAVDVNPEPVVSWQGVVCDNGNDRNTCIFTPNHAYDDSNVVCRVINSQSFITASAIYSLNLTYPPPVPPKLSGYTRGKPLQPGDSPKCTVTGGKPLVSSVNFSCSEDAYPDQPDIVQDNSVISPLVNASEKSTTRKLRCRCAAHWELDPELYTLTAEDILEAGTSGEQIPGFDQDGTNGGSSAAVAIGTVSAVVVIIVVVVTVVFFVKRKRGDGIYERALPRQQEDITVYQGIIPRQLRQLPDVQTNRSSHNYDAVDGTVMQVFA
ncbi:hypothetical protein BaRGS_00029708, partial [Batillaria attramentaria]